MDHETNPQLSNIFKHMISSWNKLSEEQPNLFGDLGAFHLPFDCTTDCPKREYDYKTILASPKTWYKIVKKSAQHEFMIFEEASQYLVVLEIVDNMINEIYYRDWKIGEATGGDINKVWYRLIAWILKMNYDGLN